MTKISKILLIAASMLSLTASASAQFIVFGPNAKVIFTQVVVPEGFSVTQATATVVTEDVGAGTITARRMTQVIFPDGSGGFTRRVTQEETIATITGPGVYSVEVTTETITTPLDASQVPVGMPVSVTGVVTETDVDEVDLDLPRSTEFFPYDPNLDDPVVISAA